MNDVSFADIQCINTEAVWPQQVVGFVKLPND